MNDMNAYSDSPQAYHRLQKIHGHGYYRLHHAWTRNNRCNDSPEITDVTTLLQFLPQLNVLPGASLSDCYISFLLGLHASRGITHEFAPDHCSMHCLCAAHLRFYIPFFGFIESGLGNALANHPGEELMHK